MSVPGTVTDVSISCSDAISTVPGTSPRVRFDVPISTRPSPNRAPRGRVSRRCLASRFAKAGQPIRLAGANRRAWHPHGKRDEEPGRIEGPPPLILLSKNRQRRHARPSCPSAPDGKGPPRAPCAQGGWRILHLASWIRRGGRAGDNIPVQATTTGRWKQQPPRCVLTPGRTSWHRTMTETRNQACRI